MLRNELGARETSLLRRLVMARSAPLDERELAGSLDWERLFESANLHRLAPLAAPALLEGTAARRAPVDVLERFQNVVRVELARAVVHLHHVDEIAAISERANLEACLLKGAAFAKALYADPTKRPMADVDILARARDWSRWSRCLESMGYTLIDRSDHAACFRRRQTGVFVELHQSLTSQASYLGFDADAVLDRAIAFPGAEGTGLKTLAWEDHLLHLCLHASFQHGFRQAAVNAWDAHLIAERPELDVAVFVGRSGEPRLAPWVYGGLSMSLAVFPHPKLEEARRGLESVVPRRIHRRARRFTPEALLSPDRDSVWGTPFERLSFLGLGPSTLSLLLSLSRPHPSATGNTSRTRTARLQHLVRKHGIAAIQSIWNRAPRGTIGGRSASLGEVRDV